MKTINSLILTLILIATTGCSQMLAPLKAAPSCDSGFLGIFGPKAAPSEEFPFHRSWIAQEGSKRIDGATEVHVANVDLEYLDRSIEVIGFDADADEQEALQVAGYLRTAFLKQLESTLASQMLVLSDSGERGIALELALVELSPTEVSRSIIGTTAGIFVPGGGLLGLGSQGTVAIEGRLRDLSTGEVLFVFADRESGRLAPINLNDFTRYSHARDIIDDWASQIAQIIATRARIRVADRLPVTLQPI